MKKGTLVVLAALLVLAIISSVALAWTPEGQKGYEGQPGNQGGYHQNGQQGYEGQPGNQGGGQAPGQQGYEGQPGNQGGK